MNSQVTDQQMQFLNSQSIPQLGITFGLFNENDFTKWRATMMGPIDTSYKGGLFYLSINFPPKYPVDPPIISFLTPIYHINVNPFYPRNPGAKPLGYIPIEALGFWKPNYSIKEIFLSIYSLFYYGNLICAFDIECANEFKNDKVVYEEKIKFFTEKYANPLIGINEKTDNRDFTFYSYY